MSAVLDAFDELRADRHARWGATLAGVVVGLGLAWFHWLGLIVGAALVALPRTTIPRGVAAGIGFGVVAVAANLAVLASTGTAAVGTATAMTQVFGLSVGLGLATGLVGGLVRGVV
jgi:hypothetical protein